MAAVISIHADDDLPPAKRQSSVGSFNNSAVIYGDINELGIIPTPGFQEVSCPISRAVIDADHFKIWIGLFFQGD